MSADQREPIERAAPFSGDSMSAFMVAAAVQRADDVIARQSATVVSAAYFDQLLAARDESADKAPRLAVAAEKARRQRRIRTA